MYPLWTSTLYQMLAGNLALLLTATGMVELFRPHWNRATYIELWRSFQERIGDLVVRDAFRLAIKLEFTAEALGDDSEAEHLAQWSRNVKG